MVDLLKPAVSISHLLKRMVKLDDMIQTLRNGQSDILPHPSLKTYTMYAAVCIVDDRDEVGTAGASVSGSDWPSLELCVWDSRSVPVLDGN